MSSLLSFLCCGIRTITDDDDDNSIVYTSGWTDSPFTPQCSHPRKLMKSSRPSTSGFQQVYSRTPSPSSTSQIASLIPNIPSITTLQPAYVPKGDSQTGTSTRSATPTPRASPSSLHMTSRRTAERTTVTNLRYPTLPAPSRRLPPPIERCSVATDDSRRIDLLLQFPDVPRRDVL